MTLYLARRVTDGEVDETTSVYLGRCDEDGCRYLADHRDGQIAADALEGHTRRTHPSITAITPSLLSFNSPRPVPMFTTNDPRVQPSPEGATYENTPPPRQADPIGMHPSPTPRGQEAP